MGLKRAGVVSFTGRSPLALAAATGCKPGHTINIMAINTTIAEYLLFIDSSSRVRALSGFTSLTGAAFRSSPDYTPHRARLKQAPPPERSGQRRMHAHDRRRHRREA